MESKLPIRKTQNLRRGRNSVAGARYFVTLRVADARRSLCESSLGERIERQLASQHAEGDFEMHCSVLMPDHLHLIFRLGKRLSLGRCIAKFKAKTRELVGWQSDFHDRRIREDEPEEMYGLYVFMNPYKAKLLGWDERWPFWKRWKIGAYEFETLIRNRERVPVEWLRLSDEFFSPLVGPELAPRRRD